MKNNPFLFRVFRVSIILLFLLFFLLPLKNLKEQPLASYLGTLSQTSYSKHKSLPLPLKNLKKQPLASHLVPLNHTIYSKHWPLPLPLKNLKKQPLVFHNIFTFQFDPDKKFPIYIAYHLQPQIVWGKLTAERKYKSDPYIKKGLIYSDYKGASNCDKKGRSFGYDKGHLAPLGSFKSSVHAYEAQYMSNIVPQKTNLNQGPWRRFEEKVRKFVKKGNEIYILTGPLYEKKGNKTAPCWKAAQSKIKELPSSYFKIALDFKKSRYCSVRMPQNAKKKARLKKFETPIKQIENKSGLQILSQFSKIKQDCSFLF